MPHPPGVYEYDSLIDAEHRRALGTERVLFVTAEGAEYHAYLNEDEQLEVRVTGAKIRALVIRPECANTVRLACEKF